MEEIKFPIELYTEQFDSVGLTIAFPEGISALNENLEIQSFFNFYTDLMRIIPADIEIDWLLKGYKFKDTLVRFMQSEGKERIYNETWCYYVYPNLTTLKVNNFMPKLGEDVYKHVFGIQFETKNKIEEKRLGEFFNIYYAEKPLIIFPFLLDNEDIMFSENICIISKRIITQNTRYSKEEIINSLKKNLKIASIYIYEGEEKINTLFKCLWKNKILYSAPLDPEQTMFIENIKREEKFLKQYENDEDEINFYPFYKEKDKQIDYIIIGNNILLPIYDENNPNNKINIDTLKSQSKEGIKIIEFKSQYFNYLINSGLSLNSLISTY